MLVQFAASSETWIWKALAYAVSQLRTTWQICCELPRSTWSHCGSLKADDHRVPVFPSTALEAGREEFSSDEAVAGLPWATSVAPQVAAAALGTEPGTTSASMSRRAPVKSPSRRA